MSKYVEIDNLEVGDHVTIWDCNCSEFGRQTVMAVDDLQYLPTADVVPRSEVANAIIFDIASRLHQMLPFKASSFINGEPIGNSVDFGKEKAIYEMLNYLSELKKKYAEAKDTNVPTKASSGEIAKDSEHRCLYCQEIIPQGRDLCGMCEIGQRYLKKKE